VTILIVFSHQLELKCDFQHFGPNVQYTCVAKKFRSTFTDRVVTNVTGKHVNGKTNDDVKRLMIHHQHCEYLPLNISFFFPNLEEFDAKKNHLAHLVTGDLEGLDKLKTLDLSHNSVEHIPHDFFIGHSTIENVLLENCHLKKIDNGALDPLVRLKSLRLIHNACVGKSFYSISNVKAILSEIYDSCYGSDDFALRTQNANLCSASKSDGHVVTILAVFLTLTSVFSLALGIAFYRLYKNSFRGKWSDLRCAMI
jgi:Leucine rich repeat